MTRKELLKEYQDREYNNLFCYSQNYGMTKPKEGWEKQFNQTQEKINLLEEMLVEEAAPEGSVQEQLEKFVPEDSNGKHPNSVKCSNP